MSLSPCMVLIFYLFVALAAMAQEGVPKNESVNAEKAHGALAESEKFVRFDTLSEKGWDIQVPGTADTVTRDQGGIRSALYARGVGFIGYSLNTFTYNSLDPPSKSQSFNGQRPTFTGDQEIIATYDLRPLPLHNAQLVFGGVYVKTTWGPAGPTALRMSRLAYAQSFWNDRLEVQGGYTGNDVQWVGYSVGGSLAGGSLGVNAIIPFELGLAYLPFMAPGASARYKSAVNWYFKAGVQRSSDPRGPEVAKQSDAIGLRFHRQGQGVLTIGEVGYKPPLSGQTKSLWLRGGAIENGSTYVSYSTGKAVHRNWALFSAADKQFTRPSPALAFRGAYAGASFHYAPPALNAYSQYYEARLYSIGPFARRPFDLASLVVTDTQFSREAQRAIALGGRTASSNSTAITAAYSLHLAPGVYLDPGLSYVRHPALTPRLNDALNLQLQLNLLF